jgi:hypothetical protein
MENEFKEFSMEYQFMTVPKRVGGYRMGEAPGYIQFNLTSKPNWLHRMGVRLILGWKWIDEV